MTHCSRRQFLRHLAGLAAAGAALSVAPAALAAQPGARTLSFTHTHTGQSLNVTHAVGNRYLPEALTALNRLLRDHYSGTVGRMDPRLFDLLHRLRRTLGSDGPFEIISGYRCPQTNSMLRTKGGGGVAKKSLHMEGRAIDLRLSGVSLTDLRDAAVSARSGGVGFYPESKFVHVDTGPVRDW